MIKVISPGIFSSIQDEGRFGFAHFGIPTSGAMDVQSLHLANAILNNELNAAAIEITYGNVKFEFLQACEICVSGANFSPHVNGKPISLNKRVHIQRGGIFSLEKRVYGLRTYLAIQGGINSEKVFGSRSFYKGITTESNLKKGDIIDVFNSNKRASMNNYSRFKIDLEHFKSSEIECFQGPEFHLLTNEEQTKLLNSEFTISPKNSRMGYMLSEKIENELPSILSSGVLPGTVQLTPSGELIILMRDCQVTGGYPRVLQLTASAVNRLAQKTTGEKVVLKI
ncbi:biotin-dependent carboxyltransferase family protein [Tenacibaculum sp. MEBiC06402]|uniref:5-oxoprolinase subunit C family protein n=1 Tax=unclassified Tenacibaculum TaxID=2635139 RepID=UPI003B994702